MSSVQVHLSGSILITIAAMAVGMLVARILSRKFLLSVGKRIEYDLRNRLYAHLLKMPASFFQRHPTGELMSRMTSDVDATRFIPGGGVMQTHLMGMEEDAWAFDCLVQARVSLVADERMFHTRRVRPYAARVSAPGSRGQLKRRRVLMVPGRTALTRTPEGAASAAAERVRPITACLLMT